MTIHRSVFSLFPCDAGSSQVRPLYRLLLVTVRRVNHIKCNCQCPYVHFRGFSTQLGPKAIKPQDVPLLKTLQNVSVGTPV